MIATENSPDTEANEEAECPEQDRIPGSKNESEVESDPEMEMVTDTMRSITSETSCCTGTIDVSEGMLGVKLS